MNRDLLVSVLKRAAQRGATAADGFLVEESHFSASVRMREIENINHSREQRLSLRVFAGRASAAASTSDLSRESLERVVDEATALAKITAEDPHAGLPEPSTLITQVPDLDLALGHAKNKGAKVLNGPMDVPGGGRIVQMMDPQQAAFALHQSQKK